MSTPLTTTAPASVNSSEFWERLWRTSGIHSVVFFLIAYFVYGSQPPLGAPGDAVVAFYDGDRLRILVATVLSGMALLNLLWFAAAR